MSATKKQLMGLAVRMYESKPKATLEVPAYGPSPYEAWEQAIRDIAYCIVPAMYVEAFEQACHKGGFWNRDLEDRR